jgi:SAM-dependent MidA family methyltransferase
MQIHSTRYGARMARDGWLSLREAWSDALYGATGFYRSSRPADHFRTSPCASRLFAAAVGELVRRLEVTTVYDIGAGSGELLVHLAEAAPALELVGVELRPRPPGLSPAVGWRAELPVGCRGLVLANEWLDNIACDVVELDEQGACRYVEVQPASGRERLGGLVGPDVLHWLAQWWPLAEPGARAEVGLTREERWGALRIGNPRAHLLAIDYGHIRDTRPSAGTLSSYRQGRQTPVTLDGRHDVTAAVAMDALAAAVPGELRTQREALHNLGIRGDRPPLSLADADPTGYLRALSLATEAAELTERGGLGDLCWLLNPPRAD